MATILRERPLTSRVFQYLATLGLLLFVGAGPVDAKTYTASRFDSAIRVLPGGAIEVTETVVFRFEDGTFTHVFRELPTGRTDGIEVIAARMDEREMPFGDGPDQVEVRHRSRVRVTWRFAPTSASTHTFTLQYLVRGVVTQQAGNDVLRWRALPSEHAYTIESSTIEVASPVAPAGEPDLATRRVDDVNLSREGQAVRITAQNIGKNGWVELKAIYSAAAIITVPPHWQQRDIHVRELAPRWGMGAIAVGMAGVLLLVAIRQRYDSPRPEPISSTTAETPDQLPPAMAGVIASNGTVAMQHAIAALFSLADRGYVTIAEGHRRFGQRTFTVRQGRKTGPIAPHERTLLDIVFKDKGGVDDAVEFSKARTRLGRQFGVFRKSIGEELTASGLIDSERQRIHRLYGRVSIVMIIVGAALLISFASLIADYDGWPLLIPGALIVAAIIGFILRGATTPLSNEGVRRRERWLGYQKHLTEVARSRAHLGVDSPARVLPVAVALGLAAAWSKLLKNHPTATPSWFQALSASKDDGGFPAFIAAGGVQSHGGGGSAGGGAAGGGASGAG